MTSRQLDNHLRKRVAKWKISRMNLISKLRAKANNSLHAFANSLPSTWARISPYGTCRRARRNRLTLYNSVRNTVVTTWNECSESRRLAGIRVSSRHLHLRTSQSTCTWWTSRRVAQYPRRSWTPKTKSHSALSRNYLVTWLRSTTSWACTTSWGAWMLLTDKYMTRSDANFCSDTTALQFLTHLLLWMYRYLQRRIANCPWFNIKW